MGEYTEQVTRHAIALGLMGLPENPRDVLVSLDIDGTIVTPEQQIYPAVKEYADRLRIGGVHICITTGRSVPATLPVVKGLELESAWIASANGSLVGHFTQAGGYTLTNQYTFDPRQIVARVLQVLPEACIGVEDNPLGFRVSKPFPPGELRETLEVQNLDTLLATPVSRVVIREPQLNNEEFHHAVKLIDFTGVEHAIGWRSWLDINPPGTSKGHGLATVCENLGVDLGHTIAIGDGGNDIPLLRTAGYGVAMGNARPEVKAAADATTLPDTQQGAGAVLEALTQVMGL